MRYAAASLMSVAEAREAAPCWRCRRERSHYPPYRSSVGLTNSPSACDEQMFDELIVGAVFRLSGVVISIGWGQTSCRQLTTTAPRSKPLHLSFRLGH